MEKRIILTKSSGENDIKRYFSAVLNLSQSNKEFPVNLDDVWALVYRRKEEAVRALTSNGKFLQDVDYQVLRRSAENPNGGRPTEHYYLTTSCLEFFIARKVRAVFEIYRRVFHRVVMSDEDLMARALVVAQNTLKRREERILALEQRAAEQSEQIQVKDAQITELSAAVTEMKPKVSYVDTILQSRDTVSVTAMAQDYGQSAKAFNILLRNMRIQHKVGQQWIVYAKYLQCGYVQSETFTYTRSDGSTAARLCTKWTQKGRLFLYDTLKSHGIIPLIEQAAAEKESNENK